MLIRLMILAVGIVLVSLVLGLRSRLKDAPPWLRMTHQAVFYAALAYVLVFAAIFLAFHLFGYRL